mmetsp:Transcript_13737/g.31798  ORF Transcript_13737/g.31798 Transcript_13737/m.31798 type:complete len:251 (+) Transcript_13737:2960-3712(+)
MTERDSTGSSTASMDSGQFSSMMASPLVMASSTWSRYLLVVCCTVRRPWDSSRRVIHLMPCSCGSIMSGQRLQLQMMAPFCTDTESEGRPSLHHDAISASSVRTSRGSMPSVMGIWRSMMSGIHLSATMVVRKRALKAPMYDTNADAITTSPTRLRSWMANWSSELAQRTFSSARPFTRRSAKLARCSVRSICWMAAFLSAVACSNCPVSLARRASRSATLARTADSALFASSSLELASASFWRLGSTIW